MEHSNHMIITTEFLTIISSIHILMGQQHGNYKVITYLTNSSLDKKKATYGTSSFEFMSLQTGIVLCVFKYSFSCFIAITLNSFIKKQNPITPTYMNCKKTRIRLIRIALVEA
jgi:hypothetical protein